MKDKQLDTPILLLGFVRFETAQKVFDKIRKVKPKKFFLAVDGPRAGRPDDASLCQKTQDIIKQVDWECEVKTLFQKENLGCGLGTVTAINWFFENVQEGIIFDDDCVPNESFFYFCQELLSYYRDNNRIMHISGDNFQEGKKRGLASYYFSQYTHNWGWATWRRAWKYNEYEMVPKDTWDDAWCFSVLKQKGLSILPNVNLISNIGFGEQSTHTTEVSDFTNLPTKNMDFPLVHPKLIYRNILADLFTNRKVFGNTTRNLFLKKVIEITPEYLELPVLFIARVIKKIWK